MSIITTEKLLIDHACNKNTKLVLDKTYHNSIEEAIKKYLELQSILKNNL